MTQDFDTHIAVYEYIDILAVKRLLSKLKEQGLIKGFQDKIIEVVGSSQPNFPKAIFTCEVDELHLLNTNHKVICEELEKLGIPVIVESEQNFDIGQYPNQGETQNSIKLLNENRKDKRQKHWGDIHVDIPTTFETTKIRHLFNLRGFNYIITVKKDRPLPHTIITSQFKSSKQLKDIINVILEVASKSGFPREMLKIKGERLIEIDNFGQASLLPMTVGFSEVNA